MKILIIRFSSIGDIVLTTPVIRCLKKQVPDVELHYLTKKSFASIIESNPYIDKRHYLTDNLSDLTKSLQQEEFDYVVDLHHNIRSLKVRQALGIKGEAFKKLNIEKWLLTTFKINIMPDKHVVDRYLETVEKVRLPIVKKDVDEGADNAARLTKMKKVFEWIDITDDGKGLDYFIPEADRVKESDLPAGHLAGYIGIAIGATYNTKKLPVRKLQELCKGIDHPIILLGGKEDREAGELISSVDRYRIYNACGKFNLNESADLVRRSKFMISHDTGLMHVATALKKQVISVWGNTVPDFGMYPYYGEQFLSNYASRTGEKLPYDIVEVNNLGCRPCSKIGYAKCPLKHFKCMNNIDIPDTIRLVNERLSR